MSDETVISVKHVSKNFYLPQEKHSGLKQAILGFRFGKKYENQHALKDISFDVKRGEFFGIVGRNGSGKSTMLRIIAGIYRPTKGKISVNGKLVPFIELGVGFNQELTGRDNVYLNGALLGFNRREMSAMYGEIVAFAELEDFMDQKLKNYSSGMQVRLAFSIAIRARSDILLIDEVLAVGDEAFQRKCLDIFEQYKAQNQTIVLVTHDMEMVRKFCSRAILIHDGNVIQVGNPRAVAEKYSQLNQQAVDVGVAKDNHARASKSHLKVDIENPGGDAKQSFGIGDHMVVSVGWSGLEPKMLESIGVSIFKLSGEHVTGINSRFNKHDPKWKENGQIALDFKLDIAPGKYYILVEAFRAKGEVVDSQLNGPQFTVSTKEVTWSGLVQLPHKWIEHVPAATEGDRAS